MKNCSIFFTINIVIDIRVCYNTTILKLINSIKQMYIGGKNMLTGGWWMYYVENYFPLMYAIMRAEQEVFDGNVSATYLGEIKQKIKDEYLRLIKNNFYEDDIDYLMKIDMTSEYESVLFDSFWKMKTEIIDMTNQLVAFLFNLIKTYK